MYCQAQRPCCHHPAFVISGLVVGGAIATAGVLTILANLGHQLGPLQGINALSLREGIACLALGSLACITCVAPHCKKKNAHNIISMPVTWPRKSDFLDTICDKIEGVFEKDDTLPILFVETSPFALLQKLKERGYTQFEITVREAESAPVKSNPAIIVAIAEYEINPSLYNIPLPPYGMLCIDDGKQMIVTPQSTEFLSESPLTRDLKEYTALHKNCISIEIDEKVGLYHIFPLLAFLSRRSEKVILSTKCDTKYLKTLFPSLVLENRKVQSPHFRFKMGVPKSEVDVEERDIGKLEVTYYIGIDVEIRRRLCTRPSY